jgi:hypothetical protein
MASKKKIDDSKPIVPTNPALPAEPEPTKVGSVGLEAIVNDKTRYGTVNAFSGMEYVRYEYRPVPAGFEDQARKHPYLTVRPRSKNALAEMVQPAPAQNPEAPEVIPAGGAPAPVDEEPPVTQVTENESALSDADHNITFDEDQ